MKIRNLNKRDRFTIGGNSFELVEVQKLALLVRRLSDNHLFVLSLDTEYESIIK